MPNTISGIKLAHGQESQPTQPKTKKGSFSLPCVILEAPHAAEKRGFDLRVLAQSMDTAYRRANEAVLRGMWWEIRRLTERVEMLERQSGIRHLRRVA